MLAGISKVIQGDLILPLWCLTYLSVSKSFIFLSSLIRLHTPGKQNLFFFSCKSTLTSGLAQHFALDDQVITVKVKQILNKDCLCCCCYVCLEGQEQACTSHSILRKKACFPFYVQKTKQNKKTLTICAHRQGLKEYIQNFKGKHSWEVKFWRVSLRKGFTLQCIYFGIIWL